MSINFSIEETDKSLEIIDAFSLFLSIKQNSHDNRKFEFSLYNGILQ